MKKIGFQFDKFLIYSVFVGIMLSRSALADVSPSEFNKKEVAFTDKKAGVTLAGKLYLPKINSPLPAVIIIAGAGPYVLGPYFLSLADALAQKGIAVLCYDKRGLGKSSGDFKSAHTEDLAQDALAGFEFLRQYPGIDPLKVGMIGHSQGAQIVPMVTVASGNVDFVVLMSGEGIRVDKRHLLSDIRVATYEGADPKVIRVLKDIDQKSFVELETQDDESMAKKKLDAIINKGLSRLNESEKGQLRDVLGDDLEAFEKKELTPGYRAALIREPGETIEKIKCPVLAINGDKDTVMVYPENLKGIAKALKKGKNSHYTIKVFPGLNHLLQLCKTGSPKEVVPPQETFAPEVIQFISDWVVKKTK